MKTVQIYSWYSRGLVRHSSLVFQEPKVYPQSGEILLGNIGDSWYIVTEGTLHMYNQSFQQAKADFDKFKSENI